MSKLIGTVILVIAGVYLIANGVQYSGIVGIVTNFAGQQCLGIDNTCLHPEWVALGAGLLAIAFIFYRSANRNAPRS